MSRPRGSPLSELQNGLDRLGLEARFDTISRTLYSTDASNHRVLPVGVAFPRHVDEVPAIVTLAAGLGVPVLPRGAGTSLGGQAVGPFLILDTARHLDRILEVDPATRTARVEPGVVCRTLNRAAGEHRLQYGPDPASADRATFGGMIGNNATGAHSIRYGMTADHLREARVVVGDGSIVTLSAVDEEQAERRGRGAGLEAGIYRTALALRSELPARLAARWPKTWRRSSGYGLDYLAGHHPEAPAAWYLAPEPYGRANLIDLAAAFCGSEGTLGVLLEAQVGLVARPAATALVLLSFPSVIEACRATPAILEAGPSAIELVPAALLERARQAPAYGRKLGFLDAVPPALLAVEFEGETPSAAAAGFSRVPFRGRELVEPSPQADFWEVRRGGLGLLMSVSGDVKPITFIEDVAVPVGALADYVGRVDAILNQEGTTAEWYAHASAGCLHMRPMVNLKSDRGRAQLRRIAEAVVRETVDLRGAISGEHGDGLSHTEFNQTLFGPELTEGFRRWKAAFDPRGILNPGKVVSVEGAPAGGIDRDLRYPPGYGQTVRLAPAFAYTREQGLLRAVEACSGVGVCRKDDGVMCPSFQATREEADSTRGRANVLRAALTGALPAGALTGPEMHRVLDLCLECKGCKAECPTGVDMARLKAEYLALYQRANGVSIRSKAFARIASTQEALAPFSWAHNRLRSWGPFRRALQALLRIDRRRTLPPLHRVPFRGSVPILSLGHRSSSDAAILFVDSFTDRNHPEVGRSALRVLEAAGFRVGRAAGQVCCGRPMISKGLLDEARELARRNLAALAPHAEAEVPIVGLEPSCLLTLRDEYLEFFPDDERARAVARQARLLEEALLEAGPEGRRIERLNLSPETSPLLVHNHCHTRALVGSGPALEALRASGASVRETGAGCCGMAGSFGYETEHYDLSTRIGEMRLLPEVRGHPGVVLAPGFSCRTQIFDGTGVVALHPGEYLAGRLVEDAG